MATNTGSNGGKNNSNGVMRTGGNIDQGTGINSALNQANYRREYNDKMFSDSGYLNSSIKDLQKQAEELDKILEKSKQLTQVEKTRFAKMSADMKKLAAEQNEMFTKQEASSKELQSTLNESSKLRLKAVDELYRQYMKKEKELNDAGKKQVENKIRQFAAASREIKADVEDINEATKNFENAKKSLADGVGEFVDNLQSGLSDFIKVVSLNNLSSNEFLDKANERYKIMNKINSQLGYDATNSTRTYNSLVSSFNDFSSSMNNLFSLDDLNQYIQDSNNLGIHNEQILKDTLQQSMIASKYLGLSTDTQSSLFKYMKLTNNNDMIANYNKTMVALQKRHIGVSEDMLDQLVMQGTEVNDVLTAAGADVSKWNSGQQAFAGVLSSKGYTDDQIKQLTSGLNEAVINLTTTSGIGQLAQMGINPQEFKAAVQSSDYTKAMEMFVNGNNRMSSVVGNDISASGFLREQLGLNLGVTNTTNAVGKDLEGIKSAVNGVLNDKNKLTEDDVKDAIENNKQQTWVQGAWNWLQGKVEEIFGGSGWLNFETLGTAAFTAYLASSFLKGGKVIIDAFKSGGFLNKLFTSFFGKGSTLAGGAEQMSLFASGGGTAGKALGMLGTGAAVVGLTAAVIGILSDINSKIMAKNYGNQYGENMSALKGTKFENNAAKASADTVASSTQSTSDFFKSMGNVGGGFGYLGSIIAGSDKKSRNEALTKWMYNGGVLDNSDYVMAWAVLMDQVNSTDAVNSAIGTSFSTESIGQYLNKLDKDEENSLWNHVYSILNAGWHPYKDNNGGRIKTYEDFVDIWDGNKYENTEGYHLAGLDRVPKDNYRALLHKDEMVLNKSDAEAYREMFGQITGRNGTGVGGYGVGDRPFNGPYVINAGYPTYSSGKHHGGIDLSFQANTPVGSAAPGTVARSEDLTNSDGSYRSYGRLIVIKGDNGADYYYAHLNERLVGVGQRVNAGDLIGKSGSTGNSTGPHLHFEVRNPNETDPSPFLASSVWEIGNTAGASSQLGSTVSDSSGSSNRISAQLAAVNTAGHRAIPGLGGKGTGGNGPSSTDRIVNSVDGVSSKIIRYLDEIRSEQADQRRLINAFSASQTSVNDYR